MCKKNKLMAEGHRSVPYTPGALSAEVAVLSWCLSTLRGRLQDAIEYARNLSSMKSESLTAYEKEELSCRVASFLRSAAKLQILITNLNNECSDEKES